MMEMLVAAYTEPDSKFMKALLMLAAIQHSRVWLMKEVLLTGVCIKRCEDTGELTGSSEPRVLQE